MAFKEANAKESKVYKNYLSVKDEIDSSHLWAGNKIKNMYKNTNMNFTGVRSGPMTRIETHKETDKGSN